MQYSFHFFFFSEVLVFAFNNKYSMNSLSNGTSCDQIFYCFGSLCLLCTVLFLSFVRSWFHYSSHSTSSGHLWQQFINKGLLHVS
uniref:Uncharacterized protein n=1 Tax=Ixodes scapularis TaxID=6945 RepID=A0A4D5RG88_IXOSC